MGYESQSTFTRAFKKHFKVTPNEYRLKKKDLVMLTKTQISIENIKKRNNIEYKIIEMGELKLIGLTYTSYENTYKYDFSAPTIRDDFYYKLCECSYIPKYHRCFDYNSKSTLSTIDNKAWDIFIGIDFNEYLPNNLELKIIPSSKYLCFIHYGELNKLERTVQKVWLDILPNIDYEINNDYTLYIYEDEVLGEYFYPGKPMQRVQYKRKNDKRLSHDYMVKILIPLSKKARIAQS